MHLLVLVLALVTLLGTATVLYMVQSGRIESRKIVIGAMLMLLLSSTAVIAVAVQESTARAESVDVKV
jgi:hypothetical protein